MLAANAFVRGINDTNKAKATTPDITLANALHFFFKMITPGTTKSAKMSAVTGNIAKSAPDAAHSNCTRAMRKKANAPTITPQPTYS